MYLTRSNFSNRLAVTQSVDLYAFKLLLAILVTAHIFDQVGVQYLSYLRWPNIESWISRLLTAAAIIGSILGAQIFKRPVEKYLIVYLVLCLICGGLTLQLSNKPFDPQFFVKGIAVSISLYWLFHDIRLLILFTRVVFYIILTLCIFNSFTLAHYFNIVDLPFQAVPRIGGNPSEHHLDPYSFGIFGKTENHVSESSVFNLPRLQGFGSEPLHWGYVVLMGILCGLAIKHLRVPPKRTRLEAIGITFLALYGLLLQSSTMYISMTCIILIWMVSGWLANRGSPLFLFFTVILPSLIIPLILINYPELPWIIFGAGMPLDESTNLKDKIDYTALTGTEVFIFMPNLENEFQASHNLILYWYLAGGVFFLMTFLYFFCLLMACPARHTNTGQHAQSFRLLSIFIFMHLLHAPSLFFYPSGAATLILTMTCVRRCNSAVDQCKPN
jgi:hypothetical protein